MSDSPANAPGCDSSARSESGRQIDWQAALLQHGRWLRTVVAARVREPDAVDEILQEVALAAVRQSAPLRDPGKVAPWLYRLAVRQVLLFRRRCGRQRRLTDHYAGSPLAPVEGETPDPLAWLLADERRSLVRQAMTRLRPTDAQLLLLKYTEHWTYHQLAEHLGVSHAAVEARLHRARARLRGELALVEIVEAHS